MSLCFPSNLYRDDNNIKPQLSSALVSRPGRFSVVIATVGIYYCTRQALPSFEQKDHRERYRRYFGVLN